MFYRESGQFKSSYKEDMQAFPIREDKIGIAVWLLLAYLYVPFFGLPGLEYGFALNAIMIPVLIFTITTIGLNILVGYTGQISLGTAAFMGVGAYSCYKLTSYFPDVNIIILIFASGFFAAAVGALFGLPSLRIKGFYLVVATLAAQFF
jgi:branched-chain amino acid transport system permease protein